MIWSSLLCIFLQLTVTSSLFGPNIRVNTMFSNTVSLCSSLIVRDQVLHPYSSSTVKIYKHVIFTADLVRLTLHSNPWISDSHQNM
jgi:hypothetical protein